MAENKPNTTGYPASDFLRTPGDVDSERFLLLLEATSDAVWDFDLTTGAGWCSKRFNELFGYSCFPITKEFWLDAIHPDDKPKVMASLDQVIKSRSHRFSQDYRIRRADGSYAHITNKGKILYSPDGVPVRMVGAINDTSEQRIAREGLGRLAGGIAHDFNNLLMVITSYTEILQHHLGPNDRLRGHAEHILEAANRATGLTNRLLAFSREQIISPEVMDLNQVLDETAEMLKRLIGEHIEMSFLQAKDLWAVKADRGQIAQVVTNLCVNARDAMLGCGRLTIETSNAEIDSVYAASHPPLTAGTYVSLSVKDTGPGMTDDVQSKASEPFYTTKPLGNGTGLGLAAVYGIVTKSGGHILVSSEPDHGSCIRIYLPRAGGGDSASL